MDLQDKLKYLEENEMWSTDVDDNPPTYTLMPDKVDYLNEKLSSKIISVFANFLGYSHIKKQIKSKKLVIKSVNGLDNFLEIKGGLFVTCNHFNPFDNFAVYEVLRPYLKDKTLWKVIREGNFTNFPGLYGFLFRHCNTLPLSSNTETMKKFLKSVSTLIKRGETILIYPEQALWTNYKKHRPLQAGAFNLAAKNNAPVLPIFITLDEGEKDKDGNFIYEYNLHIGKAIYPDPNKHVKENVEYMKNENYRVWKEIYEDYYKIPLTYLKKEGNL